MKHNVKISLILLTIFLFAQYIGLGIVYNNIDQLESAKSSEIQFKDLPIGERPALEGNASYLGIIFAILLGTGILFLLMKYKLLWVWKIWFLLAMIIVLFVAFGSLIDKRIALLVALVLSFWKVFKPNVWVQNFTELFIYGGLAVIFVPLLNLTSVIILLLLISVYDAYAVWKSKHMIKLAKSQSKAKVFAGLLIPYKLSKRKKKSKVKVKSRKMKKVKTAMLGGGDIGFPLIFAGVVLIEVGIWQALLVPLFALVGLATIFFKGKKNKFYPAMPFITAGCLLGLLVVWGIGYLV